MSLFGQAAPATNTPAFGSTAPIGFNTTSQPVSSGFSFGSTSNATTTPSATSSFGTPLTSQPQQPTGFGTSSLFGGTSTSNTMGTTPSLFGGNNNNATNTFGLAASNTGTFGSNNNVNKSFPSFGFSSTGGLNANPQGMNNMAPQQRDKMIYDLLVQKDNEERQQKGPRTLNDMIPENIWQSLALMKSWWDPESPNCRFKTYFYNMVSAQEVHLYQRPVNHDQNAWNEAQKKNPDPTCMVPTQAIGFRDIEKRMEAQNLQSQAHKAKLQEIDDKLKKLQGTTLLENENKLMETKRQYMEVTQRVIKFLKHTQILRQKGLSITPEEELMRTRFESIQDQLQQSEQFHGTLSQMWAQLQLIKESGRKYGSIGGVDEWDSVSPSHVEEITKILDEQQRGIQHTIDVLQSDNKAVNMLLQQSHTL